MAFEANYQEITLNQIRSREIAMETAEGDVIVPDVQGDVGKVLQVKTSCAIESREVSGERLNLSGTVYATILYLPAEGTGIEAMHTTLPFQHTVRLEEEKTFVEAEAEIGEVTYYLYHSRKLNLKVVVNIKKQISSDCSWRVLTGCKADCDTEVKYVTVPYVAEHIQSDQVLAVREQTELAGSLPDINRILFCEGKIRDQEIQLMTNKAMIKGEIVLSFFYYSMEETAEYAEHVIPFTEVIDAMGVSEEMEEQATLLLSDLQMRAGEDGDGDLRMLYLDAKIFVSIRAVLWQRTELVEDLFCTDYPISCSCETISYSRAKPGASKDIPIRENVSCQDQPSIGRIYLMNVNASLESVTCRDGKTQAEGGCTIDLLYQSPEGEYCSLSKEIPFSQELEGELSRGDMKITTGNFSYHLLSAGEVELRGTIYIEGTAAEQVEVPCILQAEAVENAENDGPRPSLVIYFTQPGDTLWNVAKHYSVTRDSIVKANKLPEGALAAGQKILIPR